MKKNKFDKGDTVKILDNNKKMFIHYASLAGPAGFFIELYTLKEPKHKENKNEKTHFVMVDAIVYSLKFLFYTESDLQSCRMLLIEKIKNES